uniref:MarR family winged helix-turn-helix transcriptional regulator n=1 Tax=Acetatifactor sp. TaxID=1872090 RepID=UPI004056C66A
MAPDNRSIGFRLKSVNNMIRRFLDTRFAEQDITEVCGMQGPMLGYIHDKSKSYDVFQRDLEKEFNIRRSTATVMLQNLEQKGFIVREPVEHDARLKKIILTEKAIEHNRKIHDILDAFHKHLEAGISPEEKQEFFRILDKIEKNLT